MAEDTSTEVSQTVVLGELTTTRAQEAYELKLQGKKLSDIADELGYRDGAEVSHAIAHQLKREAAYLSNYERGSILQMEFDRLDRIQEKLWPAAMMGDPKSAEAVLKVIDRRIKIAGLDSVDTATQQQTVLVIGGQEQDYVNKLKELTDDD